MKLAARCQDVAPLLGEYVERTLAPERIPAVEEHLRTCTSCREAVRRAAAVNGFLAGVFDPEAEQAALAETGRRLREVSTGPLPTVLGDDEAEPAAEGFLDSLSRRFGAAPWWMVSGAFHGLLILLLFLIGMAIMQVKKNDTVIVTSLEKQKEKEPEKEPEREIFRNPQPLEAVETVTPQPEVVLHEEVEVSDHFETDENMNQQDAFGDEGISDIPLGGSGFSGAIGVGGGASGAFGRPLGGGQQRLARAIAGGGGKATESAVDKALEWLARHQEADGHWDAGKYGAKMKCDTSMTGFALLAFLGAGHTEKVGKYKDHVKRGVEWLVKRQQANGCLAVNGESTGYNHAIAGMALAEAAAMGRLPETKAAAQKAIDYSVDIHQCGDGGSEKRGWRYKEKQAGDLSNSGWFIMQLKSAKVAGLHVDPAAFEGAIWFLDHCEDKNFAANKNADASWDNGRHRYGYTSGERGQVMERPMRTAIGCLSRQFMGTPAEELQGGVEWFVSTVGARGGGLPGQQGTNLYYWYYGTLCTFQQGGDVWKRWNEALKKCLLPTQRIGGDEDGSWDPENTPGPGNNWGACWGRVGQTAISAMCLEVYYRYLPMYR